MRNKFEMLKVKLIDIIIVMQGLISNLIRPFRFRYSIFDLGPKFTDKYDREDGNILNDRGFKIQYSYYKNKTPSDVCLVYAHCNSGCRVQGIQFVQPVMDQGWNLCLFDFAGSGISQGDFISLGYYESIDLQTIITVVLRNGNNRVHLWGRSMGAATIILYLSQTKQIDNIISCVLDSPYSSLWRVVKQFGKSKTKIPQFIVEHLMEYIRKSIVKDHQFDIKNLQLLKKVQAIDLSIMFIASTNDSFVNCNHAAELYKLAVSKHKVLEYIEKQHNSPRESNTLATGLSFMMKSLNEKEKIKKQMRILSKKKQLCRRMTGNNMAELITKPTKKPMKTQSISTGNLARFKSFCTTNQVNNIKQQKQNPNQNQNQNQNQDTNRREPSYRKQNTLNKNPHTIQHSIIKLTMQPKQIIEQIKNNNQNLNNEPQHQKLRIQQFKFNATLNPKMSMKKQYCNTIESQDIFMKSNIYTNQNNYNNFSTHNNFTQNNYMASSINNNQAAIDKENDLNISNNMQDIQESIFHTHSEIKNFNALLTKRNNFQTSEIPHNIQIKIEKQQKEIADKKQKTQKLNKLYIKQRKSVDEAIAQHKQTDNKRIRQNGIQLINKINKTISSHTNSPISNKQKQYKNNRIKQRVKTQIIQTNYNNQEESSEQYNIIEEDDRQQRERDGQKQINRKIKQIENKYNHNQHKYSSYSDISIEEQQRQVEPVRWNCQPRNFCQLNYVQDQTKQATNSKYGGTRNYRNSNQCIDKDVNQVLAPRRTQLSYNQVWNQDNNQLQLKHFQSIGDLPTSYDYPHQNNVNKQENYGKMGKINNNHLHKTQKIIKIQLDRNILKGNQPSNCNKNEKNANPYANNYRPISTNVINSIIQINPMASKLKMKSKKMLKINTVQTNNSFL